MTESAPPALHAVTPYGRTAGSSRVRVFEWAVRAHADVRIHSYLGTRRSSPRHMATHPAQVVAAEAALRGLRRSRPERLLLHREASPLSRGGTETDLLAAAELSVYDFDDALQWDVGEGGLLRRLAPKSRKALVSARTAMRVIAGNAVLADWAANHARDVVVIPSCVAPEMYARKTDYRVGDPPRLVWIGSRSEEHQLIAIAPALTELHRRTGARLTVIGGPGETDPALTQLVDRLPWSERTQHSYLATADLGLMPLADTPMDRGKCGYKLLQYLAAGLPAVASPVGVNSEILRLAGLPSPSTSDEWLDALVSLLGATATARAGLGRQATQTITEHYSYTVWQPTWEAAVGLR